MDTISIDKLQYLTIGQQGENNALVVPIDMTSWVEQYPESSLSVHVLFRAYDEELVWPVTATWDSSTNLLTWDITSSVTAKDGLGYTEIRAVESHDPTSPYEGLVKKSKVIPTMINQSITGVVGGSRPAPYQDFLNQVLAVKQELNEIFQEATTEYVISTSYSSPPETGWSEEMPNVAENKGKYLWTRLGFEWGTGATTYVHTVTYISIDTTGAVVSVNSKTGAVSLDAGDIKIDDNVQASPTIATALAAKMDSANIVYSDTEPASPVAGMIWLKPKVVS